MIDCARKEELRKKKEEDEFHNRRSAQPQGIPTAQPSGIFLHTFIVPSLCLKDLVVELFISRAVAIARVQMEMFESAQVMHLNLLKLVNQFLFEVVEVKVHFSIPCFILSEEYHMEIPSFQEQLLHHLQVNLFQRLNF